jgi:hypothetical protein
MVIDHVFREPMPRATIAQHATLLEALQAGIASQSAPLGDAELTGTACDAAPGRADEFSRSNRS